MHFQPVDRTPFWVPWWWGETRELWTRQGHGPIIERDEEIRFGCDHKEHIRMWLSFEPPFEEEVIEEDEEYITSRSQKGVVGRSRKDTPHDPLRKQALKYPIENRDDYLRYRDRLSGKLEERLSRIEGLDQHNSRYYPVSLRGTLDCGFHGPLCELMGIQRASTLYYTDPGLVEMMNEDRTELIIQMIEAILEITTIDWFCFWEDMAYKNGPMISPELFRKFMVPYYRRVTDFLHSKGVDIIFVDSDGDISLLIPLWLECGVNGLWPLEVRAGMDVRELRREYGRDLLMMGGLNMHALMGTKADIRAEILAKVPPLIKDGGYIPRPDHEIPPDVPYENYCYFMEFLRDVLITG